ncbi:MAG: hypothetical protein ACNA7W_04875 [Pseudomonadales bacterium]
MSPGHLLIAAAAALGGGPLPATSGAGDAADLSTSPAIFTYKVDDRCRVTRTRKLQGPDDLQWRHVDQQLQIFSEATVWRMIDGTRRQLTERRVALQGEMVRAGELICLLSPLGEVLEASIARLDARNPRQRIPILEPAPLSNDGLGDLGTFSVVFQPPQP